MIGGGAASAQASVGIREVDPSGSAMIVGQEKWFPYDRPPLSKGFLTKDISPEDIESKDPSFYQEKNIEVLRGVRAESIDRANQTVGLSDGSSVGYEKLLLATGSTPRKPNLGGLELSGVTLLRTVDDSIFIKKQLEKGKSAVMVGAGYIGMEIASAALTSGMDVTLIDPADRPWSKFTTPTTGAFLRRYFEKSGARFMLGNQVKEIVGDGQVRSVRLANGEEVPADLVVVGVGIAQNLDLARQAGLEIDDRHGVVANERLQTSDPNIYVAGDIAAFFDVTLGRRWHHEHYLNAQWTGKQAGRIMAGADERYERVPYFFSDMLDLGMILRGDPEGGPQTRILGDIDNADFVEVFGREDGTLAMGMAFTRDSKKLDAISDELEKLIPERPRLDGLTEEQVGLATAAVG